jgi:predicted nucleotidyltransferase
LLEEILIREAKRREEVFKNLSSYLNRLKETLRSMDPKGRLFLFGSSARGDNALISDIDILIVTSLNPSLVIATLWQAGFDEPFEFHVVSNKQFETYKQVIGDLKEILN